MRGPRTRGGEPPRDAAHGFVAELRAWVLAVEATEATWLAFYELPRMARRKSPQDAAYKLASAVEVFAMYELREAMLRARSA